MNREDLLVCLFWSSILCASPPTDGGASSIVFWWQFDGTDKGQHLVAKWKLQELDVVKKIKGVDEKYHYLYQLTRSWKFSLIKFSFRFEDCSSLFFFFFLQAFFFRTQFHSLTNSTKNSFSNERQLRLHNFSFFFNQPHALLFCPWILRTK